MDFSGLFNMTKKSYESEMYIAQMFRASYQKFMEGKYGGEYPIKQSRNVVSFPIGEISSHITFRYRDNEPFLFFEMSLTNGGGVERTKSLERRMDIKRSKTGRISGDYYLKILRDFVMPNIKSFYKEWVPKQ